MTEVELAKDERARLWADVVRTRDIEQPGAFWYPLVSTSRVDVVAFEAVDFHAAVGAVGVRNILARHHVAKVLFSPEFDEYPARVIDLSKADFRYTGAAEGYWCDYSLDWLIYASHEESITLGGAWLIGEVQRLWPQWKEHLWRTGAGF